MECASTAPRVPLSARLGRGGRWRRRPQGLHRTGLRRAYRLASRARVPRARIDGVKCFGSFGPARNARHRGVDVVGRGEGGFPAEVGCVPRRGQSRHPSSEGIPRPASAARAGGAGVQNTRVGRHGRSIATEMNKTNEPRTHNQNTQDNTRQRNTKAKKNNHKQQEHTNQSTTKNQQQNPHPAWNQDSRGRRADGSGR